MKRIRLALVVITVIYLMACSGSQRGRDGGLNQEGAELNVKLGLSYLQKDRVDLALIKLNRALSQAPDSSRVNWAYALLEEKLGKVESASKYYRKAIKLNPKDSEAHNNYGAFLCSQDRVQEAINEFDMAVANPLYSTPEYAYLNAGLCAAAHADNDQAEAYFRKALDENDQYVSALYQMALLSYREKRYLASRAFRQRVEEALPEDDPKVLWLCVVTELELQNTGEANECKRTLKKDFPTSSEAASL
jgi:type IV pilus assembly protein PilF